MSNLVIVFAHRVTIIVGLRDIRDCVVKIAVESSSTCLGKQRRKLLVFTATIHVDATLHLMCLMKLSNVGQFQSFDFKLHFCWFHDITILLKVLIQLREFIIYPLQAFFDSRVQWILFILRFVLFAHRDIRKRPFRKWVGWRCCRVSFVEFGFAVTGHVLTVCVINFCQHFGLLLMLNLTHWQHITLDCRILQKMINSILVSC